MFTTKESEGEDDYNERKRRFEMNMPWSTRKLPKPHHTLKMVCARSTTEGIRDYCQTTIITQYSAN